MKWYLYVLSMFILLNSSYAKSPFLAIRVSNEDAKSIRPYAVFYKNSSDFFNGEVVQIDSLHSIDVASHCNMVGQVAGRLLLINLADNSSILDRVIVHNDDSVVIAVTLKNVNGGQFLDCNFSGHGSARYQCSFQVNRVRIDSLGFTRNFEKIPELLKSSLEKRFEVINEFEGRINSTELNGLKIDCAAQLKDEAIKRVIAWFEKADPQVLESYRKLFTNIITVEFPFSDVQLSVSPFYGNYLFTKAIDELKFSRGWGDITFEQFFGYVKNNYNGSIRDRIYQLCFLNSLFYNFIGYEDPYSFNHLLDSVVEIVQDHSLKERLLRFNKAIGLGASAYDFDLAADSSGKMVRLADFKGKVLLIDIWAYKCTGCYSFSAVFHEKIYPYFKDRSDFSVVSIMNDFGMDEYLERLRSKNVPFYTYPEYINLYGGEGSKSGAEIKEHYMIDGYPFLVLIDRNGKIACGKIPYFIDHNSPNIGKLKAVIEDALAK